MRKALVLCAVMLLVAGVALAKTPARECPYTVHPAPADRDYFEGFEGVFPPAGWTQVITNPDNTWEQSELSPYEGTYCAHIPWQSGNPQDEWLYFDYAIVEGEDHLNFATMGSMYWCTNANFYVTVNGDVVFDFCSEFPGGSWEYQIIDIDLTAYIGETVTIGFGYVGDDGADQHLDAVGINDGYEPPPPPENDTCDGALEIPTGDFLITGSTDLANNDYDPGDPGPSCTGYSAEGPDVVYFTCLAEGAEFTVTMTTDGFDDSIYLITDCSDPSGSCVAGDDAYPDGSTFTYIADATGIYYLIVDAYSGSGNFTIEGFNGGCPSAVETASWSTIKALYK